jgi:hypothetical protein
MAAAQSRDALFSGRRKINLDLPMDGFGKAASRRKRLAGGIFAVKVR